MAEPAIKRRKTDHVASGDEGDDAKKMKKKMVGQIQKKETEKMKKQPEDNMKAADIASRGDASATFKNHVFKVQVEQMLDTIRRPQHGREKGKRDHGKGEHGQEQEQAGEGQVEGAVHAIKQTIEQIPPNGPFLVADAERHVLQSSQIVVPFPHPRPAADSQLKFGYSPPANINVVGSFVLQTSSEMDVDVDMVVVMPPSLFEAKDHLNYRYFYKRAYYLASIAAGLEAVHKDKGEYSLRFCQHHGNPLKPILVVTPEPVPSITGRKDSPPAPKWRINIIPCAAPRYFSLDRLNLDRNCLRNIEPETAAATPFYNSSIRSDMVMIDYLKLLYGASKSCGSFIDACLLARTWLRQRSFASSIEAGGFGNFEFNALMALGLQGGGPNGRSLWSTGYSSYQLFRATLHLLAVKDFIKHPWIVGTAETPKAGRGFPLVWDAARSHNLLYKASRFSYRMLRNEAKATLIALRDQLHDGFDSTFILRVDEPLYRFDYHVDVPERLLLSAGEHHDHNSGRHLEELYRVLEQGLGDRVTQITISKTPLPAWPLGSSRPTARDNISIGLLVDPDKVKRTVDHGPPAENKSEAASFRAFWGDKSELRRFKDGSILESLIWSTPAESGGQAVLEQIIGYLLNRHWNLPTMEDMHFSGDGFSKLLPGGTDITPFTPLMEQYRIFENDIRELRDLPLSIRQIMPSDPQLCYSSILPPGGGGGRNRLPTPANVTLQFESSGRWPDDLIAIQRTKIAFLLMISSMLQSTHTTTTGHHHHLITTRIGLENPSQPVLNQAFLDITYNLLPTAAAATFRLRIYHDREQHLFQRVLAMDKKKTTTSSSSDPKSREIAALGLARYKRDFIIRPAQTQALIRLATKFPALSGAIRLMKLWFEGHFLLGQHHIPEEVVELLVVKTFTTPAPWSGVPTTCHVGFLRTLYWISRWDWRSEPLIVDFLSSTTTTMMDRTVGGKEEKGVMTEGQVRGFRTEFEAWRKVVDPGMGRVVLFVGSSVDESGVAFTEQEGGKGGGVVVAGRMTGLARAAVLEVREKGPSGLVGEKLFRSGVEDFDFVIYLASGEKKKRRRGKKSGSGGGGGGVGVGVGENGKFKNLELAESGGMVDEDDVEKIGFSATELYLRDLEEVYGNSVLFFRGGEEFIAGLWSPVASGRRAWRVNLAYSTVPTASVRKEGEAVFQAELNREGMVSEMVRLGGSLVEAVEFK